MKAGASVEPGEEKEDPLDFVLWKAAKPGEPQWASPWGPGRPGWHIECSAMSLRYLGETIDIHGGGQDLIFPHHENEIAQSESFTGLKPFARYWLHNGLVQLGSEKMSKSLGNLITIKEALKKYSADALRIFVLSSHYRSPLTYSEEVMEAAKGGVERLLRVISRDDPTGGKGEALDAEPYRSQFIEAMDDDFNTPQALGVLFDLARVINQAADAGIGFRGAKEIILRLSKDVFGLELEAFDSLLREPEKEIEPLVNSLIKARNSLRKAKQWSLADEIRNKLTELGISLEDAHGHTVAMWKRDFNRELTPKDVESLVELRDGIQTKLIELGISH
jgi:cysteinyl-tRNA synthetase